MVWTAPVGYSDGTYAFANVGQSLLDDAHPNNLAVETNTEGLSL
jgi:hypothetical protein